MRPQRVQCAPTGEGGAREELAAKWFGIAVALATALWVGVQAYATPSHNWDMIAYVAAALQRDGLRGDDLLRATYDAVRKEVSAAEYDILTAPAGEDYYRHTVSTNAAALEQNLQFYTVRPAYIAAIRLLGHGLGIGYPKATYLVSALTGALSVLALALLFTPMGWPQAVLFPVIIFNSGLAYVASMSVPDALAGFAALSGLLALARRSGLVHGIAIILPAIRPDYLILSLLLCLPGLLVRRSIAAGAAAAASLAAGVAATFLGHGYGWVTAFNFAFITGAIPFPADMVVSTRLADYLGAYSAFATFLIYSPFVVPLSAACILAGRRFRSGAGMDLVYAIAGAFFAAHVAIFPSRDFRFYDWFVALTYMALIDAAPRHACTWPAAARSRDRGRVLERIEQDA
jgi:hypothetical protein